MDTACTIVDVCNFSDVKCVGIAIAAATVFIDTFVGYGIVYGTTSNYRQKTPRVQSLIKNGFQLLFTLGQNFLLQAAICAEPDIELEKMEKENKTKGNETKRKAVRREMG